MKRQRFLGVILVALSILILLLAVRGTTPEEKDVTAVLYLLPLGIYAIFTKQRIMRGSEEQKSATGEAATSTGGKKHKTHL